VRKIRTGLASLNARAASALPVQESSIPQIDTESKGEGRAILRFTRTSTPATRQNPPPEQQHIGTSFPKQTQETGKKRRIGRRARVEIRCIGEHQGGRKLPLRRDPNLVRRHTQSTVQPQTVAPSSGDSAQDRRIQRCRAHASENRIVPTAMTVHRRKLPRPAGSPTSNESSRP
jgi:hypothetical protein